MQRFQGDGQTQQGDEMNSSLLEDNDLAELLQDDDENLDAQPNGDSLRVADAVAAQEAARPGAHMPIVQTGTPTGNVPMCRAVSIVMCGQCLHKPVPSGSLNHLHANTLPRLAVEGP